MIENKIPLTEEEYNDFINLENTWNNVIYEMGLLKIRELELQQTEYDLEMRKNDLNTSREMLLQSITLKHGPGTVDLHEKNFILENKL
jgi:hypothetical protein